MELGEGPLVAELKAIGEGRQELPDTMAKRHHFVPAFVLARFADPPGSRRAFMYQLDTATGKPQKTTPDSTAFEPELYTQRTDDGPSRTIESLFSIIEKHAAPALDRLVDDPKGLSGDDRQTLAYFFAFQYMRTPVGLAQLEAAGKMLNEFTLGVRLGDPQRFRHDYREAIDPSATDEEIEAARIRMQQHLRHAGVEMDYMREETLKVMLSVADPIAEAVHQMQWLLVTAESSEFVTSDRALAMYDPSPRFPWSGHAWHSSPDAQTTFPIDPKRCLLMEPGPPRGGIAAIDADHVERINLRTYGWADRYIYGRSQTTVQLIRKQAKARPSRVIRPQPHRQVLMEEADPADPTVGVEHVKRGWPKGLWHDNPDGTRTFCSYEVVDPSDRRTFADVFTGDKARRVIERAIAEGKAPPGRADA